MKYSFDTEPKAATISRSSSSLGSTIAAGRDTAIVARGANGSGSIAVQGSDVSAGNNLTLASTGTVDIGAAKNETTTASQSSSSSFGVGVTAQISTDLKTSGVGVTASVAASKGQGSSDDVSYTNSHLSAGNVATITSGGDTIIKGGVISGNQVVANVGGNLSIASLQDTSVSQSSSKSIGAIQSEFQPSIDSDKVIDQFRYLKRKPRLPRQTLQLGLGSRSVS